MTDLPLNITADPDSINKWLADAILNSTIGKTIQDKARAVLNEYKFQAAIEETIRTMVTNQVREFVQNDPTFKAMVTERIQLAITPQLIDKIAAEGVKKMDKGY